MEGKTDFITFLKKIYSFYYKVFLFSLIVVLISSVAILLVGRFTNQAYSAYGVTSESMIPTLYRYDLVIVKEKSRYKEDDIITFTAGADKDLFTHRIVEVRDDGNLRRYRTKGDANESRDSWWVDHESISGSLLYSVRYAGFFAVFLNSVAGIILLIIIPANTLLTLVMRDLLSRKG